MEEQTLEKEEKKERKGPRQFVEKNGWLISAILGVLSILSLLGTTVTYVIKVDGQKYATDIHLWDYFKGLYEFDWTMHITLGLIVLGIVMVLLHKLKKELDVAASMLFILAVTMLVLTREFFSNNYSIENLKSVKFGWGSACSIAFSIGASTFALSNNLINNPIRTRDIAEDGILIAAAFVLNLIKLPIATGGGSINFQMLPLFLIALRHGPAHGLICGGIIYGLVTCLTDGWGFATYPFDYLIGFGSVMVLGYFKNLIFSKKQTNYNIKGEVFLLIACTLSTLIRFVGSTASSIIVYQYSLQAAMVYNMIYIPVSGAIAAAVIMGAYGPLAMLNNRFPIRR